MPHLRHFYGLNHLHYVTNRTGFRSQESEEQVSGVRCQVPEKQVSGFRCQVLGAGDGRAGVR